MHVCKTCMYVYVRMYVCVYVCMYARMYVYVCLSGRMDVDIMCVRAEVWMNVVHGIPAHYAIGV